MCDSDSLEVLFDLVEDVSGDEVDVVDGVQAVLQTTQRLPDLIPGVNGFIALFIDRYNLVTLKSHTFHR